MDGDVMKVDNPDSYPDVKAAEARIAKRKAEFERFASKQHVGMREDIGFPAGHQWSATDIAMMNGTAVDTTDDFDAKEPSPRPMVTFNRVAALLRATYGAMIHNQLGIGYVRRVVPSENGQQLSKDDLLSSSASYFRTRPVWNADAEDRDMFMDMLTCGIGCQRMVADDEITGEVELLGRRVDPLSVGWDTRSRRIGLVDRRWNFYKTRLSEEEMEEEFPSFERKDDASDSGGHSTEPDPGVFSDDEFEVYHWQWYEVEKFYRVIGIDGPKDATAKDLQGLEEGFDFVYADGDSSPRRRRFYWEAYEYSGSIMRIRKINVNAFTYEFATGIRDDIDGVWYGMVRDAKDPQRWANKFLSLFIEIVATSGKGIIAEEDAFPNARETESSWSDPATISWANVGAVSGGKIMPKPESKLPPSANDILMFSTSAVREVLGVSLETIAQQLNDQAGVVEEGRKQAAMAVVAWAFASLRDYYHRHGHLLLKFMTTYIEKGRMVRISYPDQKFPDGGDRYAYFDYDDVALEVEVDEVPNSPNKKAEVHRTLVSYTPMMQDPSVPPAFKMQYMLEMLRSAALPGDMMRRLEQKAIPQPDPVAEQMKKLELANLQATVEKLASESALNQSKMVEPPASAMLDQAKAQALVGETQNKDMQSAIDILNNIMNARTRNESAQQMSETRLAEKQQSAALSLAAQDAKHTLDIASKHQDMMMKQQQHEQDMEHKKNDASGN